MFEKTYGQNDPKIIQYFERAFHPEDEVLAEIRNRSRGLGIPQIHVAGTDGLHLEVLARGNGAKKIVEIGTLAGYSGVCLARALPADGRLHTFEFKPDHAEAARESFRKAGVEHKITIHVGPALENLAKIENEGPFDLVFIDADKVNYPGYIAWAAKNLRKGGVVLGDNTFAWGLIAEEKFESREDEASVRALREFNRYAAESGHFRSTILPTGEGLTMAVKL